MMDPLHTYKFIGARVFFAPVEKIVSFHFSAM